MLKKNRARPEGDSVRPELLAALLMIADELHLDEARAHFPLLKDLSPMSSLHFHINHYVTAVDLNPDGNRISITITLELPQNADSYKEKLMFWIARKLVHQIRRVNVVLREACHGALEIDERIRFHDASEVDSSRSKLPEDARTLLESGVHKSDIVNRDALLEAILNRWRDKTSSEPLSLKCVVIWDISESDWSKLQSALQIDCKVHGGNILTMSFDHTVGHAPSDLLQQLRDDLVKLGVTSISEDDDLQWSIRSLSTAASDMALLLLLEHPNRADEFTQNWLSGTLLKELRRTNVPLCVVIVMEQNEQCSTDFLKELKRDLAVDDEFMLENFTIDDIAKYLRTQRGFSNDEASKKAIEIFEYTDGIPMKVLNGQFIEMYGEVIKT